MGSIVARSPRDDETQANRGVMETDGLLLDWTHLRVNINTPQMLNDGIAACGKQKTRVSPLLIKSYRRHRGV